MTATDQLVERLRALNRAVARDLWAIHDGDRDALHLVFPEVRDGSRRIAEQESRVVFCHRLEKLGWRYAVETPTRLTYKQKGETPRSASTDISLYAGPDLDSRHVNIELKAHNPVVEGFRKDLEKLVREGLVGVWFHTLKNTNRGTFPSIFGKIRRAFIDLKGHLGAEDRAILFAFCILERGQLLQGGIETGGSSKDVLARTEQLFDAGTLSTWDVLEKET